MSKDLVVWLIIGWTVATCLWAITLIGKERKPNTAGGIIFAIILSALEVTGWLYVAGRL